MNRVIFQIIDSSKFALITVLIVNIGVFTSACEDSSTHLGASSSLDRHSSSESSEISFFGKQDHKKSPFPSERDLAMIIPKFRAIYPALSIIPEVWLDHVDQSLFESNIRQRISEESAPEDWSLVALRISPCSPLGHIAEPNEIDRLCWPEVRLVLQPIVQLVRLTGNTFLFPEDRAIHALYRADYQNPYLVEVQELIKQGLKLEDLDAELLSQFEQARDGVATGLLQATQKVRVTDTIYDRIAERPEFNKAETEEQFWEKLTDLILTPYCNANALYHLTAMSLPLGRAPVPLDLWSFVAFDAEEGHLKRADLKVRARKTGKVFLSFEEDLGKTSEDVSAAVADPQMLEKVREFDEQKQKQIFEHTILDQTQVAQQASQIIDPYQTLIANTTCSSCHRFNDTPFNFHNLSYFGDFAITVSPRVEADVSRDLDWINELIVRLEK